MKHRKSNLTLVGMLILAVSFTGCQPPVINPENGPIIKITQLPEYETSGSTLIGRVNGVQPDDHKIAVYYRDYYGWQNASASEPLTDIDWYSGWSCAVGYLSTDVIELLVFLVPKDTEVPICSSTQNQEPSIPEALTSLKVRLSEDGGGEGEGEPGITITQMPEYDSGDDLDGKVTGVYPADYKIAVVSHGANGWQNEPSADYPLTTIYSDSTWSCWPGYLTRDVQELIIYLVPVGTVVPACDPCAAEPVIPEAVATLKQPMAQPTIIDPDGGPKINVTSIPVYESYGSITGTISGVDPFKHKVMIFQIGSTGWKNMPSSGTPLTDIDLHSAWTCSVGSTPADVTSFTAFLVPAGTVAPVCNPCNVELVIPEALAQIAITLDPPPIVNPEGGPKITITGMPAFDWSGMLKGSISGVNPYEYRVAVFTQSAAGNWVSQPTFSGELNQIHYSSLWDLSVYYYYSGDTDLKRIMVYLVPKDTVLTACAPCTDLPVVAESVAQDGRELPSPPIVDPGGEPKITVTEYPEYGDWDYLRGTISGVNPYDYKVAGYALNSFNGWYNIPYSSEPLTNIDWESKWKTYGNSHGIDGDFIAFLFFLVPKDTVVPDCYFCEVEPEIPEAIAMTKLDRPNPDGGPDYGQHVALTTNLPNYPLLGQFPLASKVQINGTDIFLDAYRRLNHVVDLGVGLNSYTAQGFDSAGRPVGEPSTYDIVYDPNISTADDSLLYALTETGDKSTLIINLTQGVIWGILPQVNLRATSNDGQYVVAVNGNVYRTSDHTPSGATLPFPAGNTGWPKFSGDDKWCFVGYNKYDFATRTLVRSDFPISVYAYTTVLLPEEQFITSKYGPNSTYQVLTVDLATDAITAVDLPKNWYVDTFDQTGTYGFYTGYAWALGYFYVYDLTTMTQVYTDYIDDFAGEVAFSHDGANAYIGCGGNQGLGGGGVYVYSFANNSIISQYDQFGANSLAIGPDDLVYCRSACENYGGSYEGTRDHQGIEVLKYNPNTGKLDFVKSYYLANGNLYVGNSFFIKGEARK